MKTIFTVLLLTLGLAVPIASAQDFTLEPIGFTSIAGTSTDGVLTISGAMGSVSAGEMKAGDFAITGEFRSLMAAVPPAGPPKDVVTTIFDNTGGEENGITGPTATTWLAGKFCLGSQPYDLDSVSLLLSNQDSNGLPGPPSTIRLQIYSNDPVSGKPSASTGLIMNLSDLTNPITPPPHGRGLVKWTPATPFRLAANTCYWAVLSRESGGYIGQMVSTTKPSGPAGTFGKTQSDNAGATWDPPANNYNFKMLIQGTASGPPQAHDPAELIVNGSFENTPETFIRDTFGVMSLPSGSSAIPGWGTTSAELAWVDNVNTFGAATPFGTHSLDLTGYHDGRPYGAMTQTIPTVPGLKYRLSLALGSNADYPGAGGQKSVLVCVGSSGTVLTLTPTNTTGNQWQTFSFGFTATSASTEVSILGLVASGVYLGLDNVSVVSDDSAAPPTAQELVANGSFDEACGFLPDGSGVIAVLPGSTVLAGWTTTMAELGWGMNGNAFGPRSPYGSLFLDLTGYHDGPPYGGISQTLATTPGKTYRLSFALGSHEDNSAYRGPTSVEVSVGSVNHSFTFAPSGKGSQWGTFNLDFTAESVATPLTFQGTLSTGGAYLGLDNISVIPASEVPRAAVVGITLNELKARFPVEPGRTYTVESSEDLAAGKWAAVPGTTRPSAGASFEVSLPFRAFQPQRYYRVRPVR